MAWPADIEAQMDLCTGRTLRDPARAKAADRLVRQIAERKTWALHRHVHFVRAFEEARSLAPIRTVLTVGSGYALSELFLVVAYPEVRFTLTDLDEKRLDIARGIAKRAGIPDVDFRTLDLLADRPLAQHDLVTGIEVIEHIEDDARAAANVRALASKLVWQMVPQCSEQGLTDVERCARALHDHGHFRPGYTPRTVREVIGADSEILWVRSAYHWPDATALRKEMVATETAALAQHAHDYLRRVLDDVRDDFASKAWGIQILAATAALPAAPTPVPREDDRALNTPRVAAGAVAAQAGFDAGRLARRSVRVARRLAGAGARRARTLAGARTAR